MQTDSEKLSAMVAKVQKWLICKQWRKVIYGAISVQKCKKKYNLLNSLHYKIYTFKKGNFVHILCCLSLVTRKIQYRQENALIIQCSVRMLIAVKKYRPRYVRIQHVILTMS